MCIVCKVKRKKNKAKVEYVSTELGNNFQDFLYIKGILEKRLGIPVTKTMVLKHCLVITLNYYDNGKGV